MAISEKPKGSKIDVKKPDLLVIVLAVVLIVVVASVVAYAAWMRPWAHASMTYDLDTTYERLSISEATLTLTGKVFNFGHKDGYATLTVTITDARGYSMDDSIVVGRVDSGGGYVEILKEYDWPQGYNGLGNFENMVLPVDLSVNLTWYDVIG